MQQENFKYLGENLMEKALRIILAEDEYLCLMGLKADIEELGHQVIGEALNGVMAVEMAHKLKPDLVIIDINMPVLDGIEAINQINQKLYIPSIIVSGYHDEKLIDRASKVGVLSYLIKPVNIQDIKAAIRITAARFEEFKKLQDELQDTKKALEARKCIEKAKGIIMQRMGLSESDSMKRLQKMSRNRNLKLVEAARELIKADDFFGNIENAVYGKHPT